MICELKFTSYSSDNDDVDFIINEFLHRQLYVAQWFSCFVVFALMKMRIQVIARRTNLPGEWTAQLWIIYRALIMQRPAINCFFRAIVHSTSSSTHSGSFEFVRDDPTRFIMFLHACIILICSRFINASAQSRHSMWRRFHDFIPPVDWF